MYVCKLNTPVAIHENANFTQHNKTHTHIHQNKTRSKMYPNYTKNTPKKNTTIKIQNQ